MNKTRKAINFDLDTDELKKIFGTSNPFKLLDGYKEIKRYLKKNGFKHRQWSGYISKEPLLDADMTSIVNKMNQQIPWLKKCVNKFDVTNVGDTYDLTYIFEENNEEKVKVKPLINKRIKIKATMKVSKKAFYFESRINRKNVNENFSKNSRNRKNDREL